MWEWQQLMSTPKKYQFINKNWKIPKIKTPLSMSLSQIIKIVLVMLFQVFLLSEKRPKTYQLGLWWSTKVWDIVKGTRSLILTPKRYDTRILTHFQSPSPLPCQHLKTKNEICSVVKKKWFAPVPPPLKNLTICPWGTFTWNPLLLLLHNSKVSFVPERN